MAALLGLAACAGWGNLKAGSSESRGEQVGFVLLYEKQRYLWELLEYRKTGEKVSGFI